MKNIKAPILFKNINSEYDLNSILFSLQKRKWQPPKAYNPIKLAYYVPKNLANGKSLDISNTDAEYQSLFNIFEKHVIQYVKENDINFDKYFSNENQLKGAIYGKNDYVPEHDDLGNIKINDELCEVVYSSLLYLNDSKGGELVLNGTEFTISKGDITVFPAETIHKVKTVLSGERYAVMFRLYRKL